ncbi:MAG: sigma factor, partial [Longimicrobiales bacterium]
MSPTESDPTGRSLVVRMSAGDDRAPGALYDQYGGMVYSIAHAILGDAADAEEAAADAFLQAWT